MMNKTIVCCWSIIIKFATYLFRSFYLPIGVFHLIYIIFIISKILIISSLWICFLRTMVIVMYLHSDLSAQISYILIF